MSGSKRLKPLIWIFISYGFQSLLPIIMIPEEPEHGLPVDVERLPTRVRQALSQVLRRVIRDPHDGVLVVRVLQVVARP